MQDITNTGFFLYLQGIVSAAVADSSGGAAGSVAQQVFNDEPTPTDTGKPALSYPTGGGTLTQWTGSAWI